MLVRRASPKPDLRSRDKPLTKRDTMRVSGSSAYADDAPTKEKYYVGFIAQALKTSVCEHRQALTQQLGVDRSKDCCADKDLNQFSRIASKTPSANVRLVVGGHANAFNGYCSRKGGVFSQGWQNISGLCGSSNLKEIIVKMSKNTNHEIHENYRANAHGFLSSMVARIATQRYHDLMMDKEGEKVKTRAKESRKESHLDDVEHKDFMAVESVILQLETVQIAALFTQSSLDSEFVQFEDSNVTDAFVKLGIGIPTHEFAHKFLNALETDGRCPERATEFVNTVWIPVRNAFSSSLAPASNMWRSTKAVVDSIRNREKDWSTIRKNSQLQNRYRAVERFPDAKEKVTIASGGEPLLEKSYDAVLGDLRRLSEYTTSYRVCAVNQLHTPGLERIPRIPSKKHASDCWLCGSTHHARKNRLYNMPFLPEHWRRWHSRNREVDRIEISDPGWKNSLYMLWHLRDQYKKAIIALGNALVDCVCTDELWAPATEEILKQTKKFEKSWKPEVNRHSYLIDALDNTLPPRVVFPLLRLELQRKVVECYGTAIDTLIGASQLRKLNVACSKDINSDNLITTDWDDIEKLCQELSAQLNNVQTWLQKNPIRTDIPLTVEEWLKSVSLGFDADGGLRYSFWKSPSGYLTDMNKHLQNICAHCRKSFIVLVRSIIVDRKSKNLTDLLGVLVQHFFCIGEVSGYPDIRPLNVYRHTNVTKKDFLAALRTLKGGYVHADLTGTVSTEHDRPPAIPVEANLKTLLQAISTARGGNTHNELQGWIRWKDRMEKREKTNPEKTNPEETNTDPSAAAAAAAAAEAAAAAAAEAAAAALLALHKAKAHGISSALWAVCIHEGFGGLGLGEGLYIPPPASSAPVWHLSSARKNPEKGVKKAMEEEVENPMEKEVEKATEKDLTTRSYPKNPQRLWIHNVDSAGFTHRLSARTRYKAKAPGPLFSSGTILPIDLITCKPKHMLTQSDTKGAVPRWRTVRPRMVALALSQQRRYGEEASSFLGKGAEKRGYRFEKGAKNFTELGTRVNGGGAEDGGESPESEAEAVVPFVTSKKSRVRPILVAALETDTEGRLLRPELWQLMEEAALCGQGYHPVLKAWVDKCLVMSGDEIRPPKWGFSFPRLAARMWEALQLTVRGQSKRDRCRLQRLRFPQLLAYVSIKASQLPDPSVSMGGEKNNEKEMHIPGQSNKLPNKTDLHALWELYGYTGIRVITPAATQEPEPQKGLLKKKMTLRKGLLRNKVTPKNTLKGLLKNKVTPKNTLCILDKVSSSYTESLPQWKEWLKSVFGYTSAGLKNTSSCYLVNKFIEDEQWAGVDRLLDIDLNLPESKPNTNAPANPFPKKETLNPFPLLRKTEEKKPPQWIDNFYDKYGGGHIREGHQQYGRMSEVKSMKDVYRDVRSKIWGRRVPQFTNAWLSAIAGALEHHRGVMPYCPVLPGTTLGRRQSDQSDQSLDPVMLAGAQCVFDLLRELETEGIYKPFSTDLEKITQHGENKDPAPLNAIVPHKPSDSFSRSGSRSDSRSGSRSRSRSRSGTNTSSAESEVEGQSSAESRESGDDLDVQGDGVSEASPNDSNVEREDSHSSNNSENDSGDDPMDVRSD